MTWGRCGGYLGVGCRRGIGSGGRVGCDSLVGHFGDKAVVVVGGVCHDLGAAVGEQDAVRSFCHFAVAGLVVAEVVTAVFILDGVGEVEGHPGLLVVWGRGAV